MFKDRDHKIEIEYREYKLPNEFPILALFMGDYQYQQIDPANLPFFHFHNCIEIGICYECNKNLSVEGKNYTLSKGDFFFISPYSMHFATNAPDTVPENDCCEYLYLNPEVLLLDFYPNGLPNEMLWYKSSNVPHIFSKDTSPYLYSLTLSILEELRNQQEGYQYSTKGLLLAFMVEFTRSVVITTPSEFTRYQNMSALLPAIQYINQNYATKITVTQLAALCHMSTNHFRNLFIELMQQTPLKYINFLRLQKACELLYSTELTILDISMGVGFLSLSNFNSHFHEYLHTSPKQWRNNRRAIQKKNIRYSPFIKKQHVPS